ncbi:O-antigen ligase family protein [Candidatus Uhrbacteria bacterium]|nr:O-antigen ligase family protein [Candidatus Uhrbacteria bacterium]
MFTKLIRFFPFIIPLYVIRFQFGPFPTTFIEIILGAIFLFSLTPKQKILWKQGWIKTIGWRLPVGLWIIATIVAVCIATNHVAAFGLWRAFVLEPILYVILLSGCINSNEEKNETLFALIASSIWIAIWCIIQFTFNLGIPYPWNTDILHRRATGPFPFPNAVALYCAPIAALCISHFYINKKTKFETYFFSLGFIFSTIATILAKSVGGFIAIGTCLLVTLLIKQKTRTWTISSIVVLSLIILLTPSLRIPIIRNLSFGDWSGKVRLIIWKETGNMLADRPIQGAGFGAYPTVIAPYHTAKWMEIFQYPHNIILNVWSETGLLGLFAYSFICFTWIKQSKQNTGYQVLSLLPLLAILIHGLVDVPYFKNDLALVFFVLIILTTSNFKTLLPSKKELR